VRAGRLSLPFLLAAVAVVLALAHSGEIRGRAEAALGRGMPPREAALARGFVLGEDEGIDAATTEDFRRSGLSHLLRWFAKGHNGATAEAEDRGGRPVIPALLGIPDLGIIAWAAIILIFAFDAGIVFLGRCYTKNYREPRWQRRATYERAAAETRHREIRVRDKSRRGPEPRHPEEKLGRRAS
jgi:hypothetical protein